MYWTRPLILAIVRQSLARPHVGWNVVHQYWLYFRVIELNLLRCVWNQSYNYALGWSRLYHCELKGPVITVIFSCKKKVILKLSTVEFTVKCLVLFGIDYVVHTHVWHLDLVDNLFETIKLQTCKPVNMFTTNFLKMCKAYTITWLMDL